MKILKGVYVNPEFKNKIIRRVGTSSRLKVLYLGTNFIVVAYALSDGSISGQDYVIPLTELQGDWEVIGEDKTGYKLNIVSGGSDSI